MIYCDLHKCPYISLYLESLPPPSPQAWVVCGCSGHIGNKASVPKIKSLLYGIWSCLFPISVDGKNFMIVWLQSWAQTARVLRLLSPKLDFFGNVTSVSSPIKTPMLAYTHCPEFLFPQSNSLVVMASQTLRMSVNTVLRAVAIWLIRKPSNLRARVIFASVDLVPRLLSARCSVWLHRAVIVMCVSLSMIISSVPFKRFTSMANSHLLAAHGCAPEIELGNASRFDDRARAQNHHEQIWANLNSSCYVFICCPGFHVRETAEVSRVACTF